MYFRHVVNAHIIYQAGSFRNPILQKRNGSPESLENFPLFLVPDKVGGVVGG